MNQNDLMAIGPTYQRSIQQTTFRWAMGKPEHNKKYDECCPDFSCCYPELFEEDADARWRTYNSRYARHLL